MNVGEKKESRTRIKNLVVPNKGLDQLQAKDGVFAKMWRGNVQPVMDTVETVAKGLEAVPEANKSMYMEGAETVITTQAASNNLGANELAKVQVAFLGVACKTLKDQKPPELTKRDNELASAFAAASKESGTTAEASVNKSASDVKAHCAKQEGAAEKKKSEAETSAAEQDALSKELAKKLAEEELAESKKKDVQKQRAADSSKTSKSGSVGSVNSTGKKPKSTTSEARSLAISCLQHLTAGGKLCEWVPADENGLKKRYGDNIVQNIVTAIEAAIENDATDNAVSSVNFQTIIKSLLVPLGSIAEQD